MFQWCSEFNSDAVDEIIKTTWYKIFTNYTQNQTKKCWQSFTFIFYRPLREVLTTLKALFQVDFLLPRTLVASLSLRELLETLETEVMPVEVSCAALVYFVKTTKEKWFRSDYEKVSRILFISNDDMLHFSRALCKILYRSRT